MKNKVKLIAALLASVLVLCGMFTLTSFADTIGSDGTDTQKHTWAVNKSQSTSDVLWFHCTEKTCKYYPWIRYEITAKDALYGREYDSANVELNLISINKGGADPKEFLKLSKIEYNTKDKKAPYKEGEHTVTATVSAEGTELGKLSTSFKIVSAKVSIAGWTAGEYDKTANAPEVTAEGIDLEKEGYTFEFEYASTDKKDSKYSSSVPKNAGHYRVLAFIYDKTGDLIDAEVADFEIKKNKLEDLNMGLRILRTDKIRGKEIATMPLAQILADVVDTDAMDELENTGEVKYGKIFIAIPKNNGKLINPLNFGPITLRYTNIASGKSGLYVPGVTKLSVGEYKLTLKIGASRNNDAATKDLEFKVVKGDPVITLEPEPIYGLEYNAYYQKLIKPGTAKGGTIQYAVFNGDIMQTEFSSAVPTRMEAGTYKIVYRIKGDSNHNDIDGGVIEGVKIAGEDETASVRPDDPDESEPSIDPYAEVPAVRNVQAVAGKRSIKIGWNEIKESDLEKVDKIEIRYSRDRNFKKGVKVRTISKNKDSCKIKGLKKGAKYYVQVRNVKYTNVEEYVSSDGVANIGNILIKPVKQVSNWSKKVNVKVK